MTNIRLIPLDPDGNPIFSAMVPYIPDNKFAIGNLDIRFDLEPTEPDPQVYSFPMKEKFTMEFEDVSPHAYELLAGQLPVVDDRVVMEGGGHRIIGHLTFTGIEIVDGLEKHRYDMHDGVFLCGPHDMEGNHIGN